MRSSSEATPLLRATLAPIPKLPPSSFLPLSAAPASTEASIETHSTAPRMSRVISSSECRASNDYRSAPTGLGGRGSGRRDFGLGPPTGALHADPRLPERAIAGRDV